MSIQRRLASVASSATSPLAVERNELAVIAAHHDALAVGRHAQDAAAVDGDLRDLALAVDQRDAFLGADKGRVSPRKCTAMTGMPSASGRTRSVTETMEAALAGGSNSLITR